MPFVALETVKAAGALADVVEFFYGDPDADLVTLGQAHGARVALYAGESVDAVKRTQPAAEIVAELTANTSYAASQ